MACLGAGLALGGCFEPDVLTAPAREPRMQVTDRERVPLPIAATPTGGAAFNREQSDAR